MKAGWIYMWALGFVLTVVSCQTQENPKPVAGQNPTPTYQVPTPPGFPEQVPVTSTEFPMSEAGVELGRMLFFDPRLSGNNQIACATCHAPDLAFADGRTLTNLGISGNVLARHSPALFNLAWQRDLFWDGGVVSLESQALAPIGHPDEMGQDEDQLAAELAAIPEYAARFRQVFGERPLTIGLVVRAIAQFERTLVSANSRYDRYRLGQASLTTQQLRGLDLVNQHCRRCHSGELFTDRLFHNNGLDNEIPVHDLEAHSLGRMRITSRPEDKAKYKTPSLRNLGFTAPYMHDGRIGLLEDVLAHYQRGVKTSSTVDAGLASGLNLSAGDVQDILAFLETLNDSSFVQQHSQNQPILP